LVVASIVVAARLLASFRRTPSGFPDGGRSMAAHRL
jgi:hypothetical protein